MLVIYLSHLQGRSLKILSDNKLVHGAKKASGDCSHSKTMVNGAASTFQIQAQEHSQSVPSILSKLSFMKQNLHCNSEVPASCSVHHHYCESLFAWIQIEGEKHTRKKKKDSSRTITFFVNSIEKEEQTLGNSTFLLLIYIIPRSWMPTRMASNSLILLAQWRELDSRKKARLHGGLALQNSAWLEVNHSLNLLKQLWRAFILFYGSLNRRASLEIWASLSRHWMLSAYCCFIERWVICQKKKMQIFSGYFNGWSERDLTVFLHRLELFILLFFNIIKPPLDTTFWAFMFVRVVSS